MEILHWVVAEKFDIYDRTGEISREYIKHHLMSSKITQLCGHGLGKKLIRLELWVKI